MTMARPAATALKKKVMGRMGVYQRLWSFSGTMTKSVPRKDW
jgi:hypothetical protein